MTTVGYGDRYPVTAFGRVVGVALMVGGIALLGTVTATLASWLVETVAAEKDQTDDVRAVVIRLEQRLEAMSAEQRELLRFIQTHLGAGLPVGHDGAERGAPWV